MLPVVEQTCLKRAQVALRYGVTVVTLWRWVKEGKFPKPDLYIGGSPRWRETSLP